MTRFFKLIPLLGVLSLALAGCMTPKMLFTVADGKPLSEQSEKVVVQREKEGMPAKPNLKLKAGDRIEISEDVDGTSLRSFQTESTVHGPATLVLSKDYLEQQGGTAMHNAKKGKLLIPGMSIDHEGAAYLVNIEENTVDLIVFDGKILVSPTDPDPKWKPFYVESQQRRKIWRDGRLAPNQPLTPEALNQWIDSENQLLKAGGSTIRMVPSVVTLPSEDAKGLIASAGFPVDHRYTEEGDGELGTITRQEPGGGRRIKASQTVSMFERSRPVKVPNVYALSIGLAIDSLRRVGLEGYEAGRTITDKVAPDMVNSQQPAAGESVAEGSSVALTVEAVSVVVPNIVEKRIQDANKALGELKLKVESTNYVLGFSGAPKVISQSPAAGSKALPDSEVTVVLQALGFEVPRVVGKTEKEATDSLLADGYQVGKTKESFSDNVAKGVVISQEPQAGAVSGKDVRIVLTVSKGKKE